jgi:ABC-type transporter Mla subunit MlaD
MLSENMSSDVLRGQALMSEIDRLTRIEQRQEALVGAVSGLTDVVAVTRDMLAELMTWLQKPPSTDLPDLLTALTVTLQSQGELVTALSQRIDALPEQLAQVVREPR